MKNLFVLIGLVLGMSFGAFAYTASAEVRSRALQAANMSEDEKIQKLIDNVRNLPDATFIRNGKEYPSAKAADHLQSKWKKHKKKIKTAHDFVERLATESKTNEAYQIRYNNGTTIKLRDLLRQELKKLENK